METNNIHEQLWQLADGNCSPEEQRQLMLRIEKEAEWHTAWSEIQVLHQSLGTQTGFEPTAGFSQKVLAKLSVSVREKVIVAELLTARMKWLVVGGFGLLTLIATLSSSNSRWSWSEFSMPQLGVGRDLWSAITTHLPATGAVLIILAFVSVFLLDRLVLSPYFATRLNHG